MRYELDFENGIVDIFVHKDDECPFPWMNKEETEAHEGMMFSQFISFVERIRKDMLTHSTHAYLG